MKKLSNELLNWLKKIGVLFFILLIVDIIPIHYGNSLNIILDFSIIISGILIVAIAVLGLLINIKISITGKRLSKSIGLKFSSISKDRDCFEYHHSPKLNLKEIFVMSFNKKSNLISKRKIKTYEEDIENLVNWLKNNPETFLYTNTHDRVKKFLLDHGKGSIKLILIEQGKRPNKLNWIILKYLTMGKIDGKLPIEYNKYKIESV